MELLTRMLWMGKQFRGLLLNNMKLHIIFGQRKCRYEGEYAPEALDIADEYTMDVNPEWLYSKLEERNKDDSFQFVKIVILDVPDAKLNKALAEPEIKLD